MRGVKNVGLTIFMSDRISVKTTGREREKEKEKDLLVW